MANSNPESRPKCVSRKAANSLSFEFQKNKNEDTFNFGILFLILTFFESLDGLYKVHPSAENYFTSQKALEQNRFDVFLR